MAAINIDVYSDVVCPWCFIGQTRLDKVLDELKLTDKVIVHHKPYALMPDAPPGGTNIHELLKQRYGREPKQIFAPAEAAAKESGLALDLSKQQFSYPTIAAHTLLRHAEAKGTQHALNLALFNANFTDARNISDEEVLVAIAAKHGFTEEEARRLLHDEKELAETRRQTEGARRLGIRGVPHFVFDSANQFSGAQPEAVFREALMEAARTAS